MSETIPATGPYPYGTFAGPTLPDDHLGPLRMIASVWGRCLDGETYAFPINSPSQAFEAQRVVKLGEAVLFGFSGFSSRASSQFIQVFNTSSPTLTTGQVPVIVISVAATTDFSADFGPWGRHFSQGIVIANSSTGPTFTAGAADTWFDAQYI